MTFVTMKKMISAAMMTFENVIIAAFVLNFFLKSQLASRFGVLIDYGAHFWEIPPLPIRSFFRTNAAMVKFENEFSKFSSL